MCFGTSGVHEFTTVQVQQLISSRYHVNVDTESLEEYLLRWAHTYVGYYKCIESLDANRCRALLNWQC
jgi:hypothetical protein